MGWVLFSTTIGWAQPYELLIQGGHMIDPRNEINSSMDIAVSDGKITRVAASIPKSQAEKVIDATGLYVTPGLIDTHAHIFTGSTPGMFADGTSSVSPDAFSFRNGITTVVDPGDAGWRNFSDFKKQVIDQSETRVLAFLNIVGHGLRGETYNNDYNDMDMERALTAIETYPSFIVGIKIGHIREDYSEPLAKAMELTQKADLPLLVECNLPELDVEEVLNLMRPGDIFAHSFESGRRSLLDDQSRVYDFVFEAEQRGIVFDVSHGGASFRFSQAIPSMEQGFLPYTLGTDLHRFSMNDGMKDMLNIMSKYLNMGMSIKEVILRATWNAAESINQEEIGHLSEGAVADVAILNLKKGNFGFVDSGGFRMDGDQKFETELTLRSGAIVWDLNGLSSKPWDENE